MSTTSSESRPGPNRRLRRRVFSILSVVLVVGGVAVVASPFVTNLWQVRIQDRLKHQLTSPKMAQAYRAGQVNEGDSLTRIKIPAIGLDMVVVQGTSASALRAGAGHYPTTALPCDPGNVAIAGHRTTFGKPFANVDRLKVGDTIELDTPIGGCVYHVAKDPFIVTPEDVSVLDASSDRTLTLTTCNPKGSAAQRLVIRAAWNQEVKPV